MKAFSLIFIGTDIAFALLLPFRHKHFFLRSCFWNLYNQTLTNVSMMFYNISLFLVFYSERFVVNLTDKPKKHKKEIYLVLCWNLNKPIFKIYNAFVFENMYLLCFKWFSYLDTTALMCTHIFWNWKNNPHYQIN